MYESSQTATEDLGLFVVYLIETTKQVHLHVHFFLDVSLLFLAKQNQIRQFKNIIFIIYSTCVFKVPEKTP